MAPIIAMLFSSVVLAQQFQRPATDGQRPVAQTPSAIRLAAMREAKHLQDLEQMLMIAGQVAPAISQSTVTIVSGSREIALGTIVSPEGHILTKAGSLRSNVKVVIAGQEHDAQLLGVHRRTDLALLKIAATDLPSVKLPNVEQAQADDLQHGHWLISYGPGNELLAMGVFAGRPVQRGTAFLGVNLRNAGAERVMISQVISGSSADRSNLWVNDVIRSIDGIAVKSIPQLQALLGNKKPYDQIKLSILRGGMELTLPVELTARNLPTMTTRRLYFEHAMEHDSKLESNQCGGPLVNLQGQIVGINILSPSRITGVLPWPELSDTNLAMAVPIHQVIPIIERLKSGKLAPAEVNRNRIEFLDRKVTEMRDSLNDLEKQEDELTARIEELQETIRHQQKLEQAFRTIQENSRALRRILEQVEEELELLRSGVDK